MTFLTVAQSNVLGSLARGDALAVERATVRNLTAVAKRVLGDPEDPWIGGITNAHATAAAERSAHYETGLQRSVAAFQPKARALLDQHLDAVSNSIERQMVGQPQGGFVELDQLRLGALIAAINPPPQRFAKDEPVFGWRITSENVDDIPEPIRSRLGIVDKTEYSEKYLKGQVGSVVTIQMKGTTPDFYPQQKSNFEGSYVVVPFDEVAKKNPRMYARLRAVPEMAELINRQTGLVAMLKVKPATMFRLSDLFAISAGLFLRLHVPAWGPDSKQDSTPGKDAFFVYEVLSMDDHWRTEEAHYYMVNESDEHPGRPIGYVPV
ncbi:MAG: hypothetical protein HQM16_06120 [Deltaproteobacteria bacterium]|nr:hypothetical protein [Deltaproteobacteria bacterium]